MQLLSSRGGGSRRSCTASRRAAVAAPSAPSPRRHPPQLVACNLSRREGARPRCTSSTHLKCTSTNLKSTGEEGRGHAARAALGRAERRGRDARRGGGAAAAARRCHITHLEVFFSQHHHATLPCCAR